MNETNQSKKPKFSLEFKQDATKLVLEKSYSYQQAADSLGVSLSALSRWVRAERNPNTGSIGKKSVLNLAGQNELVR